MKLVQLVGTKNKADFAIYLAHTIANYEKRVLIVDATKDEIYRHGYTDLEEMEYLYNLQNVEILIGAKNWKEVTNLLEYEGEKTNNYDCIIVDMDSINALIDDWPLFEEAIYVSDNDRINIVRDIPLLHRWQDENENRQLRRIHFESSYKLPENLIQLLMNNRIEFSPFSESLEYDDLESYLRLMMQHDKIIPYKKLSRLYKSFLKELVMEWFEIDESEQGFKIFKLAKRDKDKEVLEG